MRLLVRGAATGLAVALMTAFASPAAARPIVHTGHAVRTEAATATSTVTFWVDCADLAAQSDEQLDELAQMGVGGFSCETRWLYGLGGTEQFTGDRDETLDGDAHALQRQIVDGNLVQRLHARNMKIYLTAYLVNYWNTSTPLAGWFDDAAWNTTVLPSITGLAGAARAMGFDGIGFDQELYPQKDQARTASWSVDYPGRSASRSAVRAAARERGREVMTAVLDGFPGAQVVAYDTELPETWNAYVQHAVLGVAHPYADDLRLPFWDGMTSVDGYDKIRFYESVFYKTTHESNASWDTALRYDENRFYAMASRAFSNWSYAASRVTETPFAWIDGGTTAFERVRSPDYVARQLSAFRRFEGDHEFAVYSHQQLGTFDYTPYADALRAAARPGRPDTEPPTLTATSALRGGGALTVRGTAGDDDVLRLVRWRSGERSGSADLWTSCPVRDSEQPACHATWTVRVPRSAAAGLVVTAVDAAGNTTSVPVRVSAPERARASRGARGGPRG